MAQSSTDIVNAAIQQIGDNQPLVTGTAPNFDSSTAGVAAAQLYTRCVQTVAREFGWDFERNTAALSATTNTPPLGWANEYLYPTNGIQVWQVLPASISDPNDPLPINWAVGNTIVNGVPAKVLWCNVTGAQVTFANQPGESLWDPMFTEAVVRLLASELAMALEGRPDTMQQLLQSGASFETIGERRDS